MESRIDAQFYAENLNVKDFVKLGGFVKVKGGKRIPKGLSYSDEETDYWYLRVDDIDAVGNIKFQNLKYISNNIFNTLENYELKPNEVVISIAGTIGKITLLENAPAKRIILTENCAKLQIKDKKLSPKFLAIILFLPFVQKQMSLSYIQTTIPKLGLERIYNLKIPPVSSAEFQTQIIEKFEAAYNAKRAKEAEAKSLLDGIDAYLLERLGIETPAATDAKKTFFIRASRLSSGRFDPSFYKPNFQNLVSALEKQSHRRLREIVRFSSESWNQKDYFENTFPYIEISEIDLSKGEINNVNQIPVAEAPSRAKMIVWSGDIIVSTTRPSRGAIAKITEKENFSIASTGFAVIRNVNTEFASKNYLFSVLRHRICLLQMEQRSSGGNYPAISVEELGNLLIPVPPLAIQEEIAAHIQSIRERAKELERDAHREVERAKEEIERMILGEVSADA